MAKITMHPPFTPPGWTNWPIDFFNVSNLNWTQFFPCHNIHVYIIYIHFLLISNLLLSITPHSLGNINYGSNDYVGGPKGGGGNYNPLKISKLKTVLLNLRSINKVLSKKVQITCCRRYLYLKKHIINVPFSIKK